LPRRPEPGQPGACRWQRRLSYRELLEQALRLVTALDDLGLLKGDRLLVVLQNRAEMAMLHWATQLAGIVVTPINWRAKADEIDYFLSDSGARAVVFERACEDAIAASAAAQRVMRIAVGEAAGGTHSYQRLAACTPARPTARATPDDYSLLLYTSGTTGRGKGVPRRHRAERAAALAHVAQNTYRTGEITLGVMPLIIRWA
jgi:2-furoate---CoA ligase